MPKRKMINLDSAYAQKDSEHVPAGCLEREDGVETRDALLDKRKVKSRRIGDRLHSTGFGVGDRRLEQAGRRSGRRIGIVKGNAWLIRNIQQLRESGAQIGVLVTSVAKIPTRVHVKTQ